jgi:hypothetical protein
VLSEHGCLPKNVYDSAYIRSRKLSYENSAGRVSFDGIGGISPLRSEGLKLLLRTESSDVGHRGIEAVKTP